MKCEKNSSHSVRNVNISMCIASCTTVLMEINSYKGPLVKFIYFLAVSIIIDNPSGHGYVCEVLGLGDRHYCIN